MEMATQDTKPDITPSDIKANEDSSRGEIWTVEDTRHLISIWGDPSIQRKLRGIFRNNTVYDEICRRLREHGVYRTPAQCRNKTKNLRKGFRELKLRNGSNCSKSVTRQSGLFFEQLERVWGQDFHNNPGEFEGQEESLLPIEYRDGDENGRLYDGCSADGANLSDNEPREYEPQDAAHGHDPSNMASHIYSPRPDSGCMDRDRVGPGSISLVALQQLNHENMERMRDTVLELNRTFLEQQAAAEERRERMSKEHEIQLFEMFLKTSGRTPEPRSVYPVQLSHTDTQQRLKHAQSSQGNMQSAHHNQTQSPSASRLLRVVENQEHARGEKVPAPTKELSSSSSISASSSSSSSVSAPPACSSSLSCLALRLHPGEDIKDSLRRLVEERGIQAACILSCVGSVRRAELRLADSKTVVKLTSNHEIVSLVGTVSTAGMHLHASLADEEGKVIGGHVMGTMEVFTTAEILLGQLPNVVFKREMDQQTGYRELVVEPNRERT
ncbi:uncharacterized protein LOC119719695 isoform X2 [Patiria miniata]|uniref:PPC domain-containing protein n=1 Tax=Patiria miniata TaxID=46514 RepID=A0A913Z367_PATMI|nr:uncharacterized protein LOC119719695 isoform X2 [Patiria miniata]